MPRPRSLDLADVATAALAVIDRDGLTGFAMRAVAVELGMGTMSLYRYVSDRAQLEALVVDQVLAGVDMTPPRGTWQRQLTALATRVRTAIAAHPEVGPLLVIHRQSSMNSLRWGESVVTVLAGAGFTPARRVVALRVLMGYVIGSMQLDHYGPLAGTGTDMIAAQTDFPVLAETARQGRRIPAEEEFRRGLEVVLRGLSDEP
ncbi:TetR/AcrR family transcriptional regulator C-terminal domain-containing protein [Kibdelosporangium lantanae]